MINFDEVNFSECRSEEVMFLLMLSVFSQMKLIGFYSSKPQTPVIW